MTATTVSDKAPLSPAQVTARIRAEAETNACFNAVCHVFAIRERTRQQITLDSLTVRMHTEGYKYERRDYAQVLKFLALMNIGYLEFDKSNNEVIALKNIRTTLQSIGQVGVGNKHVLKKFIPDIPFKDLPVPAKIEARKAVEPVPLKSEPKIQNTRFKAYLTVVFNGAHVPFELPNGLTTEDIGKMLAEGYIKSGGMLK